MNTYVIVNDKIDRSMVMLAGGKGANLGELSKIKGIGVPEGFCLTTEAYKKMTDDNQQLNTLLDELVTFKADQRENISRISASIRSIIENAPMDKQIADQVAACLRKFGEEQAYAVRSSATAEDLPAASFAGQQDSYLNIIGKDAIMQHISKCWASLFTDRAVIYRLANGFDHRKVQLAVIVQKMIFPQAAGILFTADPVTGNRKVVSIDASFGLGEAMVSGLVNADNYKVYGSKITDKKVSAKKMAIYALKNGGTKAQEITAEEQNEQALRDEQILQLASMGKTIEEHFGCPQDIEWCLAGDSFFIVQSRPITTLFPIPIQKDDENHVYVSSGHQQMMTDAMKPMGLSFWQLLAFRPMFNAGGRLFVDVTQQLASPQGRKMIIDVMGEHDPLIKDALLTLTQRADFIKPLPDGQSGLGSIKASAGKSAADILSKIDNDPAVVDELIARSQKSVDELKQNIQSKSGPGLLDFILEDIQQLKNSLFDPKNIGVIMAGIDASTWLNENMKKWLGEKNAADMLSQSVPNNVTSQMGLDLVELADRIRPYPHLIEYLQQVKDDNYLDELIKFNGGLEIREAICVYLNKYGMRCPGEIDITRSRWSENPATLLPMIISNIKNLDPGAGKSKFERGRLEALNKEKELLERLSRLPGGGQKVSETQQIISLLRNFAGYREYPKYTIVNRFFVYKQALLKEAEKLVQTKVIRQKDDVYYLTFEEFRQVLSDNSLDYGLVTSRKAEHCLFEKLNPPRVITSDGEIISGKYRHEGLPPGGIAGLAVSSGIIEGRARVIPNMQHADLEEGDILVTVFTDPSWTPLFVSIKGLVTEVGGLMTHGAVIAREYGLPAVVGVENATTRIKDGQRIRVNGTDGFVEIL